MSLCLLKRTYSLCILHCIFFVLFSDMSTYVVMFACRCTLCFPGCRHNTVFLFVVVRCASLGVVTTLYFCLPSSTTLTECLFAVVDNVNGMFVCRRRQR